MKTSTAIILLAAVIAAALMARCTSNYGSQTVATTTVPTAMETAPVVASSGAPALTIISPQNGATVPAGNVIVTAQISNFNVVDKQSKTSVPGEGHLHFYMDVNPIPTDAGKPARPADKNAAWAHVSGTTYTFMNGPAGMHAFSVELANNDHTPVQPPVVQSVMVTVADSGAAAAAIPPTAAAASSGSGQTVAMTLTCQNIAFDKPTLTAPTGSHVVMTFVNNDGSVAHNFALYTDSSATKKIFVSDFITGAKTSTYEFDVPSTPGTYFFRCDVHPTIVFGTFIVT